MLGLFLLVSGAFLSLNFFLGVLAGGLISIFNFYGLCRGLRKVFRQPEAGKRFSKAPFMLQYFLRLALTGVALYITLVKTTASIFGLVVGLSTVVVSIVLTVTMTLFDKSYLEEV